MSRPPHPRPHRRAVGAALAVGLVGLAAVARPVAAQDRLVGLRAVSGGASFEQLTFGGDGLLQGPLIGADSVRLRRATQLSVPVSAAVPLGRFVTLDVTTLYAAGEVTYTAANGGAERTATLSGLSDVRTRVTARFLDDAFILTGGLNAPTGATELDGTQLAALRVLAAPALGMGAAPVGAGLSGTLGVLTAQQVGAWAVAAGVSYELRGTYQPVAALVAGAPSADFQPGSAVRLSLGVDGFLGRHRLAVTATGDLFGEDELRGPIAGAPPLATVKLGPVLGADVQLQVAAPRLRELVVWSAGRYRAAFARDGFTVDNSSGTYVEGGVRSALPLAGRTDAIVALDGRRHSGLAIDEGLTTSGVTSGTLTLGLAHRMSQLVVQPFARLTAGTVQARGAARERQRADLTGFGAGLVIVTRF
jgi:hypothetical protein